MKRTLQEKYEPLHLVHAPRIQKAFGGPHTSKPTTLRNRTRVSKNKIIFNYSSLVMLLFHLTIEKL